MAKKAEPLPIQLFPDAEAFEEWLAENYEVSPGIRLQHAKKNSGVQSVSYVEALDVALCYGWIDSQKEAHDEKTWLQRFTPRGKKSIWSQVNKDKVAALIESGRMKPPGLQAIETAKQNGLWDAAYAPQSTAEAPEDFAAELERNPQAKAVYDGLNRQNKYAMLFRLQTAKKPETRANRIKQFIEMLEKGEKLYP
ncbi:MULTISPECIES: YdeI/OmpD-associated family protein [Cohnella]|uniref:YdeI/OmpD-associated family protein n=1 Tax=Cohnella TaxID=329857 RepID=UPI0009BC5D89|nr:MULTISPECIES: YdeI/OmpD-associated family protein [Cohnella]MBN2981318.1 YdeI/OmpD-associated family protein [Cohnella algarum]